MNLLGIGGSNPGVNRVYIEKGELRFDSLINHQINKSVYCVSISPSQDIYAFADKYGQIIVNSFQENRNIAKFLYLTKQLPMVNGITFCQDNLLVVAGTDFQIRIYDINQQAVSGVIKTTGHVFGLLAINEKLVCGICRDNSGDHLFVWDVQKQESMYIGPAFKIAFSYLDVAIDIHDKDGLIVHGDRSGYMHIYSMENGYKHTQFNTGHKNFYGVLFTDDHLISAGSDDNMIKLWDVNSFEFIAEQMLPASAIKLSRIDEESFTATLSNDQTLLICNSDLKIISALDVPNIHSVASRPLRYVKDLSWQKKLELGKELLGKIQALFEQGETEKAYQTLIELEAQGFKREALEALCIAEKAQGKILSELQGLIVLTSKMELIAGNMKYFERLVEILESIGEPEAAIQISQSIIEFSVSDVYVRKYQSIIERLQPLCLEASDKVLAIDGERSQQFVRAEIRKAEILNRYFKFSVCFAAEKLKLLEGNTTLDRFLSYFKEKTNSLIKECSRKEIIWKRDRLHKESEVICLIPSDPGLLQFELWLELCEEMQEMYPVVYKMFVPNSGNESDDWNYKMILEFNNLINSSIYDIWSKKALEVIELAIIHSTSSDGDFDWK